jgi:hypothetical protein
MTPGKRAIKKENAMAEARVVIEPSTILLQKNKATSYSGTPSKKGRETFWARSINFSPSFFILFKLIDPIIKRYFFSILSWWI